MEPLAILIVAFIAIQNMALSLAGPIKLRNTGLIALPKRTLEEESETNEALAGEHMNTDETRLTLVLNSEQEMSDIYEKLGLMLSDKRALPLSRNRAKRHVTSDSGSEPSHVRDAGDVIKHRRRRSSVWWLRAAISLCDRHPSTCKKIEVREGDTAVNVRIEDI